MDHKSFILAEKSMLVAPAGHGKTHAISECLLHTEGKQLILTHTHAGIASIKEKIKKANIPQKKFHIETITGYAQKYVDAYYMGTDVPDRENSEAYYSFLVAKATILVKRKIIKKTINATYTGLFVDEYQDCTVAQHDLVSTLSEILPTHIFGDPLQGIFGFKGTTMINLDDKTHMGNFHDHQQKLEVAWRWKGGNEALGKDLIGIRSNIEAKQKINLGNYPAIEVVTITEPNDLYIPTKAYYQAVSKLLSAKNVLLIHPISSSTTIRLRILAGFKTPITLVESIDSKDFYAIAKLFDSATNETVEQLITTVLYKLFNKTGVKTWFSEKGVINKTKPEEKIISAEIKRSLTEIKSSVSYVKIAKFIKTISALKTVRCYRKELLISLCGSLEEAELNKKTVHESMVDKRNHTRQIGRKIHGRCIGTTLLTKGLEFDMVIVLNAQDFSCPKNLYVALTRASKRLVVFTTTSLLAPIY